MYTLKSGSKRRATFIKKNISSLFKRSGKSIDGLEDKLQAAFFIYLLWGTLSKQKSHELLFPSVSQIRRYIEDACHNNQPLTSWLVDLERKRITSSATPLENETYRALSEILGERAIGERIDILLDGQVTSGFHNPFTVITTNEELARKYVKEALEILRTRQNARYGKKSDFALDELYVQLLHIYNFSRLTSQPLVTKGKATCPEQVMLWELV